MKEFIIVYFDNSLGQMFNENCTNCSKTNAISEFNRNHKKTDVIINIIEL